MLHDLDTRTFDLFFTLGFSARNAERQQIGSAHRDLLSNPFTVNYTLCHCVITSKYFESTDMIHLAHAVLYVPPTQTASESAFSIQKWMLSGRRATMTQSNCNLRMVGRSCKQLKRRIESAKLEMKSCKRQKID